MKRLGLLAVAFLSIVSNAQEAVDLGLSVNWCNMNIGASNPFEPGEIFAWGEIEHKDSKDDCTWEKYFDTKNITKRYSSYHVTFNTFNNRGGYNSIKGNRNYDVAKKRLGGNWRMPTMEEFQEIKNRCTIQYLYDKEKNYITIKLLVPMEIV